MMKGDMKHSMSLYRMELRKNRNYFVTVIALQFMFIATQLVVKFAQYAHGNSLDPFNIMPVTGLLLFGLLLSFPSMLLYSWYREEKGHTSYQALSFPIHLRDIIRSKVKVFFSFGVVWIVLNTANTAIRTILRVSQSSLIHFDYAIFFEYPFHFISRLALLMGFSCLIIGILQKVRQCRMLTGLGVIIAGVSLYIWVFGFYQSTMVHIVDKYLRYGTRSIGPHEQFITYTNTWQIDLILGAVVSAFPFLIGVACMYAGFYLFDRYGEI